MTTSIEGPRGRQTNYFPRTLRKYDYRKNTNDGDRPITVRIGGRINGEKLICLSDEPRTRFVYLIFATVELPLLDN